MLKILKLEVIQFPSLREPNGVISFDVEFECDDESNFRDMGETYTAVEIVDAAAFAATSTSFTTVASDVEGFDELCFDGPSPFDTGAIRMATVKGANVIERIAPNTYRFATVATDCWITRACAVQIAEMQQHINDGYCIYGDFPEQAGAFRSGSAACDFVGIIRTLDNFWA